MRLLRKVSQSAKAAWGACFKPRYLWVTNTVSCGVLLAAGDGIQQQVELTRGVHSQSRFDWHRSGRMFIVGITQGLPHHVFYLWLDKVMPKKTARTVAKKILVDQLVAAPFFAITFFLVAGLLEGQTTRAALSEFKSKFPAVYLFDWCIWPPSQAINFLYVPAQYRVLYVNTVTVVWDVFLSYMKHFDQNVRKVEETASVSVESDELMFCDAIKDR